MRILTVLKGPDKGRQHELPDGEPQQIGRSSESLPLADQAISRRHSELTPDDGHWHINDLKSANGTFVNGVRVTERRLLQPGDQIRCGNTLFLFGQEARAYLQGGTGVVLKSGLDAHVEHTISAMDESMIMSVPEPLEAAEFHLKVIYELIQLIGSVIDRQALLEKVMDIIFEYFQADRGFILLQNEVDQRPDPIVVRHRVAPDVKQKPQIAVSRTIVQYVMRKRVGVLTSNAMRDERFAAGDSVQSYGIRSALCAPIKFKNELFGVIHLDSKVANYTYTEDQLHLLTTIGVQTGLALANAHLLEDRLQRERAAAGDETVASLSHSIKNIIQGLRGGADVVELGLRKNDMNVVHGGWNIVVRNLDRIHSLTMNMLMYSKQRRPERQLTNLIPLLEEIIASVQTQFDTRKVVLMTDFDPAVPPIPVDPVGIHQAVLNLLNNALEAVDSEKGVVSVACGFDATDQCAHIRVSDNGAGIDACQRSKLFQPFYSTKGMNGTGLGLVVTRKVIQEHNGHLGVDTSPEQGTTFTLTLPATTDELATSDETVNTTPAVEADMMGQP